MVNEKERQRIVAEFGRSGMTRGQYCAKHKLAASTLDYWRRQAKPPKLVEVAITPSSSAGFSLVLINGRRIESSWRFDEAGLARLIRAAEA